MNSHEDFLTSISAVPDDIERRLVFADWLEDQGSSQAEFIRLQCLPPSNARDAELARQRADELLRKDVRHWNAPIHRILAQTALRNRVHARSDLVRGWTYQRGLIEGVTVEPEVIQEHADKILSIGPIRCLRIATRGATRCVPQLPQILHNFRTTQIALLDLSACQSVPASATSEQIAMCHWPQSLHLAILEKLQYLRLGRYLFDQYLFNQYQMNTHASGTQQLLTSDTQEANCRAFAHIAFSVAPKSLQWLEIHTEKVNIFHRNAVGIELVTDLNTIPPEFRRL